MPKLKVGNTVLPRTLLSLCFAAFVLSLAQTSFAAEATSRGQIADFFSSTFEEGHFWSWPERKPEKVACGTPEFLGPNASHVFGGDPRPQNTGVGQVFTSPCSFELGAIRFPIKVLSGTGAVDTDVRVDLRDINGDILATSNLPTLYGQPESSYPYASWNVIPISWSVEAGTTYWITWWLPTGFQDQQNYSNPAFSETGVPGDGVRGIQRTEMEDLGDPSLWRSHNWQFWFEMLEP